MGTIIRSLNLAEDLNPVDFLLEERIEFMHKFKGYAKLLKRPNLDDRLILAFSRKFARDINNYRLILTCCQGKMYGEAEGLLSVLLRFMDQAWEGRNTLGRNMTYVADNIATAYTNLADYVTPKTPKS